MRLDSLPSPLNVPQELMSYVLWRHKERAKEVFARAVFWLVSGPIAIAATALLWAVSLPLTLAWAGRVLRSNRSQMLVPALLGVSFNLGVAPLATTWLWLRGVAGIWQQGHGTMEVMKVARRMGVRGDLYPKIYKTAVASLTLSRRPNKESRKPTHMLTIVHSMAHRYRPVDEIHKAAVASLMMSHRL